MAGGWKTGIVALCVLVVAAVTAPAALTTPTRDASSLSSLESGVLRQLNDIRTQHGLVPLRLSASLTAASDQHSREMGADGYFEHNSHDGTAFWKRIGRFYGSECYGYRAGGRKQLWASPHVETGDGL